MRKTLLWLAALTTIFTLIAAGMGLFWQTTGSTFSFTTVRGTSVEIYGQGLYQYDSLLIGAGFRGTDLVILFVSLPLLVYAIYSYQRGSLRGALLLTGMFSHFLYYAASLAFGASYNSLLLIYVLLLTVTLTGFIVALMSIDLQALDRHFSDQFPRRAIGRFMITAGVILAGVWLSGIIPPLMQNTAPEVMGHYTTIITYPLDLGIIAPYAVLTGVLILRRNPFGYLFASPMLVSCTLIGIIVLAQTAFQLSAGVPLTTAEIIIYSVSFMAMALVSGWLTFAYFRSLPATTEELAYRGQTPVPNPR